ncbi:MAG: hypothetical protein Q7S61_03565 [bacterium]|nr:hypothetical protein [bacterium]
MNSSIKKLILPRFSLIVILIFLFLSSILGVFYFFFVNLSTDMIMLFLSSRIFEGQWLAKGVMPWFNPYVFGGVPFGFDSALGTLHPLNIVFIFPYPFSLLLWVFISSFFFLTGFYSLFTLFTKTKIWAFLLTLLLFFSGSGVLLRMNNPIILIVIAHFGWFLYFLKNIDKKGIQSFLPAIIVGIFMTISGHIQFVLYGYALAFIVAVLFYKIKPIRLLMFFIFLGMSVSWFFLLSLPLAIGSTRFGSQIGYSDMGKLSPFQLAQFIFPFIFGHVSNGSKWNAGPSYISVVSPLFTLLMAGAFLVISKVQKIIFVLIMGGIVLLTLGIVNIPFFRAAGQAVMLLHIVGILYIASREKELMNILHKIKEIKGWFVLATVLCVFFAIIFLTPLFSKFFIFVYMVTKKKSLGLFFDEQTIRAVGVLLGQSFAVLALMSVSISLGLRWKKYFLPVLCVFIIIDGMILNYLHNYFIPASILNIKVSLPPSWNTTLYRVQTESDVRPYFGFNTYIGDVMFRPPFSKENPILNQEEEKNREYFSYILRLLPSSWKSVGGVKTVQGYNTFVPMKLAQRFGTPSADIQEVYKDILSRNSLFLEEQNVTHINSIDTSRITLTDPRWKEMGVKYYISGHKLSRYTLVKEDKNIFYYEDSSVKPIYRVEKGNEMISLSPIRENPNEIDFIVTKDMVGGNVVVNINPDGFEVKEKGAPLDFQIKDFEIIIPIKKEGTIKFSYSPLFHLRQTFNRIVRHPGSDDF